MPWLDLPRADEPEEIDDPMQPFEDVARSMADVAWSNRLFGGTRTVLHHVARLLRDFPPGRNVRILDIGTGTADIPRALLAWAGRRCLDLTVVAVDNLPAMLRLARAFCLFPAGEELGRGRAVARLQLVQANALALPFAPRSFDIALCSLAFHHLGFDSSVRVLAAMDVLTTRGFIVSDLHRDRLSLWGVHAVLALARAHPFTRHDGPASVRRAFTAAEYRKMIALSGARRVRLSRPWYFRAALVQDKGTAKVGTTRQHAA